jgi:hypothetical protein
MTWAHQRSAARGHLVQVMIGIPYFYRLFGYQYAIRMPQTRQVVGVPPPSDGFVVRPADLRDVGAMSGLEDATQQGYDLRMPHSAACWRWLLARDGSAQLLVERDAVPVATGRLTPPDEEEVVLGEVAATEPDAALALVAHAQGLCQGRELSVKERPGSMAGDAIESFLAPAPQQAAAYYVRVGDPVRLLDHLRPVLSARLAQPGSADDDDDILLSFFGSHVRLRRHGGTIAGVEAGGPMQAPASAGGAGIAPDLIAALLFGPYGIGGLAERHPDVYPGPHEALMRALFPPVSADLLTLYLP